MFTLTAADLKKLFELNEFPFDPNVMVLAGFRGCMPVNPSDQKMAEKQDLTTAVLDYRHPRCCLVQWLPAEGTFATFPASTVPHRSSVASAQRQNGVGTNQLLTGFYNDYRKGWHKAGKPTGHEAWRQTASRPIRRTGDDLDYDGDDRVEIVNPGDNIHCGWSPGMEGGYSSAGCQVVVGYPKCRQRGDDPATGPWKEFQARGYARNQDAFGYGLLNGGEVQRIAIAGPAGLERIRFGSEGVRARVVQEALKAKEYYEGAVDGRFGARSLRALLNFQEATFGRGGDDGICGPQTAAALQISWP